uniref:Fibrinogen C-terminal domain-containing protein n=1 Tax=Amphiprion percula TaxID=161767 RepID=A0A3P8U510_AMPPE
TQIKMRSLVGCCGFVLALLFSCTEQAVVSLKTTYYKLLHLNSMSKPFRKYVDNSGFLNVCFLEFLLNCTVRCFLNGGWTVFQRRSGPAVSFVRKWTDYRYGFGALTRESFFLTKNKSKMWTMRVDLWTIEGGTAFAEYKNFRLGNEKAAFKLQVGKYSGTAGDAIRGVYQGIDQNGYGFSTTDRDNDGCSPCIFGDIAENDCSFSEGGGGWWYSKCGSANLNGDYHPTGQHIGWASGLHWRTWRRPAPYSAKATRMMIKSA